VARLRAEVSGRYLSLAIASSTCWRVDSCTFGSSLMTRETVLREVPATRATSLMLARFIGVVADDVSWSPWNLPTNNDTVRVERSEAKLREVETPEFVPCGTSTSRLRRYAQCERLGQALSARARRLAHAGPAR